MCVYRYLESDYRAESSANRALGYRGLPAQGCWDGGQGLGQSGLPLEPLGSRCVLGLKAPFPPPQDRGLFLYDGVLRWPGSQLAPLSLCFALCFKQWVKGAESLSFSLLFVPGVIWGWVGAVDPWGISPCVGVLVFSPLLQSSGRGALFLFQVRGDGGKSLPRSWMSKASLGCGTGFSQGEFGQNWGMISPETLQEG